MNYIIMKQLQQLHGVGLALLAGVALALLAGPLLAADANPNDEVQSAAAALGNAASYMWQTTVDVGTNSPAPTDGKTEKDDYTTLSMEKLCSDPPWT